MSVKFYQVTAFCLAVICVYSLWQWRATRQDIARLHSGRVTLHILDAETGEPLPVESIVLGFAAKGANDLWPRETGAGYSPVESAFNLFWVSPYPVTFDVAAGGYQQQHLTLDRSSTFDQVVKLQKKATTTTTANP